MGALQLQPRQAAPRPPPVPPASSRRRRSRRSGRASRLPSAARAPLPHVGARACVTSRRTTAAGRTARATRAWRPALGRASSGARSRPGDTPCRKRRRRPCRCAAACRRRSHGTPPVAGLHRSGLLAGRVKKYALIVAGERPRRSAICAIARPSASRKWRASATARRRSRTRSSAAASISDVMPSDGTPGTCRSRHGPVPDVPCTRGASVLRTRRDGPRTGSSASRALPPCTERGFGRRSCPRSIAGPSRRSIQRFPGASSEPLPRIFAFSAANSASGSTP